MRHGHDGLGRAIIVAVCGIAVAGCLGAVAATLQAAISAGPSAVTAATISESADTNLGTVEQGAATHLSGGVPDLSAPDSDSAADQEAWWSAYQQSLASAAAQVETAHPNDYAFSYFGPANTLHMGFKHGIPEGAEQAFAATGLPYVLTGGHGYNADEARAVQDVFTDQVVSANHPGFEWVAIGSDINESGRVLKVSVTGDDEHAAFAAAEAVVSALPIPDGYGVVITIADERLTIGVGSEQVLPPN